MHYCIIAFYDILSFLWAITGNQPFKSGIRQPHFLKQPFLTNIVVFVYPVAPAITYEDALSKPQVLKTGSTLVIHVNITGIPQPKVAWFCDDVELTIKNGVSYETTDTYSTLTVKNVTGENSGKYKVTATNVVDTATAEFTVTIKGEYNTSKNNYYCFTRLQYNYL